MLRVQNRLKQLEREFSRKQYKQCPVGFLFIDNGKAYLDANFTEPLTDEQIEDFNKAHEKVMHVQFIKVDEKTRQPDYY